MPWRIRSIEDVSSGSPSLHLDFTRKQYPDTDPPAHKGRVARLVVALTSPSYMHLYLGKDDCLKLSDYPIHVSILFLKNKDPYCYVRKHDDVDMSDVSFVSNLLQTLLGQRNEHVARKLYAVAATQAGIPMPDSASSTADEETP